MKQQFSIKIVTLTFTAVIISMLAIFTDSFAAETATTRVERKGREPLLPSKTEPWYLHADIGFSPSTYGGGEGLIKYANNRLPFYMEIQAYGLMVDKKTMLGGTLNYSADHGLLNERFVPHLARVTGTETNHVFFIAPSMVHSLGANPGSGLFLRGDIGLVMSSVVQKIDRSAAGSFSRKTNSDVGVGALAGVGYGIPVSDETRFTLNLNYSLKRTTFSYSSQDPDDVNIQSLNFGIGLLL